MAVSADIDLEQGCRLGVLAFGDSITNGGGELQWGVALQSWALWLARALGLPFTTYAVDGARAVDVVARQIPMFERTSAHPAGRYDLGCLYIGVNDVRAPDGGPGGGWDPHAYETSLRTALAWLSARSDRTLTMTVPLDLARPRAGRKVQELNSIIERAGAEHDTIVVDLRDFGSRNQVMTDHVHPTAFGQIALAERALAALARGGVTARVAPSRLISFETTRRTRLRADLVYAYRHAKVTGRSLAIRATTG